MPAAAERPPMRRRALLTGLGTLGLAGCSGFGSPSPQDAGVLPSESDCPAPDDAVRVVCVPETDPGTAPVTLTVDSRSGSLPATFTLTLTNGSARTLSTNFYDWALWKRVDGAWHHIAPGIVHMPLMKLSPGHSHEWELTAEHDQPPNPGRYAGGGQSTSTVGGLGGGGYAFTTDGWFEDGNHDATTQFGVLLQFNAPELELEPTTRVAGSSHDGDTVTVRGEGNESADARLAEFVLKRVGDASDPRDLIPEQAVHDYRLRNTLPYFEEGVERVRFVEQNATTPAFGVQEPYTVSFQGDLFEVTASALETETETA